MDLSGVLDVQAVLSEVPTCLGDNGSVIRRHVQLVGSSAFLVKVVRFEDHFDLNEMAVDSLWVPSCMPPLSPTIAPSGGITMWNT